MATDSEVRVQDSFVTLNGLRIHYRDWGDQEAPALMLLHGWSMNAHTWDGFAAAMAGHFRVVAPDLRGHGESAWAADWMAYGVDERMADIAALADAFNLGPFALVGFSGGGGGPAYRYAARYPDMVTRLVIVDTAPAPGCHGVGPASERIAADLFATPEVALATYQAAQRPPADETELRTFTAHNLHQRDDGRWEPRYDWRLGSVRGPAGIVTPPADEADDWIALAALRCPTLTVGGDQSPVITPEVGERMLRTIPDARLVRVADSGHWVSGHNPAGFRKAVQPFLLAGITTRRAG